VRGERGFPFERGGSYKKFVGEVFLKKKNKLYKYGEGEKG